MGLLARLNSILEKIAGWIVIAAMGIIAVVIPYEVLERYVLGNMPAWSGEVSTFALVWAAMFGAPVALRKGYQIGITYLHEKLPARLSLAAKGLALGATGIFLIVMIINGAFQTIVNVNQLSPALQIPMAIPYFALPAGFLLMLLVTLEEILQLGRTGEE